MIDFGIETGELATVGVRIKAAETRLRDQIRDAVRDGGQAAKEVMEAEVPRGETGDLARSIHMDSSDVFFSAGGLGGGGYWQTEVSAGRGIEYTPYVVKGTGIYAGRGNITPTTASMMRWDGAKLWGDPYRARRGTSKTRYGTTHVAFSTRGQKPQDQWVKNAQEAAQKVIQEKVAEIDRGE